MGYVMILSAVLFLTKDALSYCLHSACQNLFLCFLSCRNAWMTDGCLIR